MNTTCHAINNQTMSSVQNYPVSSPASIGAPRRGSVFSPVRIISSGKALPSHRVSAEQLDAASGSTPGTSLKKSGVQIRYFAAPHESQSALGAAALHAALQNASVQAGAIDLLISACAVPEQALPSTACLIAHQAGLPAGIPAFDVNASCLSFLSAMEVAAALLATGRYRRIALVLTDLASWGIDWAEPEASLIFGDGAAAVILEKGTAEQGIRAFRLATYPEGRRYCEIRGGGTARNPRAGVTTQDYLFRVDGKAVFKLAARVLPDFLRELLIAADSDLAAIDLVVPHQASQLGLAHAAKLLKLPASKIVNIHATHGNQVDASIPTALHEALISGRARAGQRILLMGKAAGLSVGGMVLDL